MKHDNNMKKYIDMFATSHRNTNNGYNENNNCSLQIMMSIVWGWNLEDSEPDHVEALRAN
jgi:hypothetical protein